MLITSVQPLDEQNLIMTNQNPGGRLPTPSNINPPNPMPADFSAGLSLYASDVAAMMNNPAMHNPMNASGMITGVDLAGEAANVMLSGDAIAFTQPNTALLAQQGGSAPLALFDGAPTAPPPAIQTVEEAQQATDELQEEIPQEDLDAIVGTIGNTLMYFLMTGKMPPAGFGVPPTTLDADMAFNGATIQQGATMEQPVDGLQAGEGTISLGTGLDYTGQFELNEAGGTITLLDEYGLAGSGFAAGATVDLASGDIHGQGVIDLGNGVEASIENLSFNADERTLTASVNDQGIAGDAVTYTGELTLDLDTGELTGVGDLNVYGVDLADVSFTIDPIEGEISVNQQFGLQLGENDITPGTSDEDPFNIFMLEAGFTINASTGEISGSLSGEVANTEMLPVAGDFTLNTQTGVVNINEFSVSFAEIYGIEGENITVYTKDFTDSEGTTHMAGTARGSGSFGVGVPGQEVTLGDVEFDFNRADQTLAITSSRGFETGGLSDLIGTADLNFSEQSIDVDLREQAMTFTASMGINDYDLSSTQVTLDFDELSGGAYRTTLTGSTQLGFGDRTLANASFTSTTTIARSGAITTDFSASGAADISYGGQGFDGTFTINNDSITASASFSAFGARGSASFGFNKQGQITSASVSASYDPYETAATINSAIGFGEERVRELFDLGQRAYNSGAARNFFIGARQAFNAGGTQLTNFFNVGNASNNIYDFSRAAANAANSGGTAFYNFTTGAANSLAQGGVTALNNTLSKVANTTGAAYDAAGNVLKGGKKIMSSIGNVIMNNPVVKAVTNNRVTRGFKKVFGF